MGVKGVTVLGVVDHGQAAAAGQCLDAGAVRELAEVPELVWQQEPKATVTTALMGAVARYWRLAMALRVASKPGQVPTASMAACAYSGLSRVGWPWVRPRMNTRPMPCLTGW